MRPWWCLSDTQSPSVCLCMFGLVWKWLRACTAMWRGFGPTAICQEGVRPPLQWCLCTLSQCGESHCTHAQHSPASSATHMAASPCIQAWRWNWALEWPGIPERGGLVFFKFLFTFTLPSTFTLPIDVLSRNYSVERSDRSEGQTGMVSCKQEFLSWSCISPFAQQMELCVCMPPQDAGITLSMWQHLNKNKIEKKKSHYVNKSEQILNS